MLKIVFGLVRVTYLPKMNLFPWTVFLPDGFENGIIQRFLTGDYMTWGSISLLAGFLEKENCLETLIVIFESVSPKGFFWLNMKDSRYLQTVEFLKYRNCCLCEKASTFICKKLKWLIPRKLKGNHFWQWKQTIGLDSKGNHQWSGENGSNGRLKDKSYNFQGERNFLFQ